MTHLCRWVFVGLWSRPRSIRFESKLSPSPFRDASCRTAPRPKPLRLLRSPRHRFRTWTFRSLPVPVCGIFPTSRRRRTFPSISRPATGSGAGPKPLSLTVRRRFPEVIRRQALASFRLRATRSSVRPKPSPLAFGGALFLRGRERPLRSRPVAWAAPRSLPPLQKHRASPQRPHGGGFVSHPRLPRLFRSSTRRPLSG